MSIFSRSLRSASCYVPPCRMMPVLVGETLWTTRNAPKKTLIRPPKSSSARLSVNGKLPSCVDDSPSIARHFDTPELGGHAHCGCDAARKIQGGGLVFIVCLQRATKDAITHFDPLLFFEKFRERDMVEQSSDTGGRRRLALKHVHQSILFLLRCGERHCMGRLPFRRVIAKCTGFSACLAVCLGRLCVLGDHI